MKSLVPRKPPKDKREKWVLLGLVELYLETGKPIGSNTLKENGFDALSSATIRNYFSKLEEEGYLKQQHSSGGRVPTPAAYKLYAETYLKSPVVDEKEMRLLQTALKKETRELASYLQAVAEVLSEASRCAVFLSAPRFDQDMVMDIKMVAIDAHRLLSILVTDFGQVHTELLYTDKKMGNFTLKRLESFFRWKLTGVDKPTLPADEEAVAAKLYSEAMMRHLVGSSHFTAEDIYKTGFSKLLAYPDFNDATALAEGLGLFENEHALRLLLQECAKAGDLSCWIGDALHACSALAIPYKVHQNVVGVIALLGPNRIPYRKLFGLLHAASEAISESLTKSLYKFKITFRQPNSREFECLLLENKK
jgi:heat-inducible transcriptional repressor